MLALFVRLFFSFELQKALSAVPADAMTNSVFGTCATDGV
jgi:hypothetical protein